MRHRQQMATALIGWIAMLACSEPQRRPSTDSRVADQTAVASGSAVGECAIPPSDSSVWEPPVLPGTQVLKGNWGPMGLDSAYAYFMRNLAPTENDGRPPATLTVVDLEHAGPTVVACQPADGTRPTKRWRLRVQKVFSNIPTVVGVTRLGIDGAEGSIPMDSLESLTPLDTVVSARLDPTDRYGRSLVREAERSDRRTRAILILNLRDSNPRVRASALDLFRRLGLEAGWNGNRGTHAEAVFEEFREGYYEAPRVSLLEPLAREIASRDTAREAAVLPVFGVLCPADAWLGALERTPTYHREPASLRSAEELLRRRVETGDPQCSRTPPDPR